MFLRRGGVEVRVRVCVCDGGGAGVRVVGAQPC